MTAINNSMVQYSVWPTCNNACKFCLRLCRDNWDSDFMIKRIEELRHNVRIVNWQEHPYGVSLMGGELYYVEDQRVIEKFLELVDDIKSIVLDKNKEAKFSTVTNGMYDPEKFLFRVLDKIDPYRLDFNVSFDIKYRYSSEQRKQMAIDTINRVHERYNYEVGVQTILTQYLIDAIRNGEFDIKKFEEEVIPGCQLTLLYPHPINPLLPPLPDFKFDRKSFFWMMKYLRDNFPRKYDNFYLSTINSAIFKKTGAIEMLNGNEDMQPILADGKEIINPNCRSNHSSLYQCYSDCSKCMLCDLLTMGKI